MGTPRGSGRKTTGNWGFTLKVSGLCSLFLGVGCAFGAAVAGEAAVFKVLKLDGHQVAWHRAPAAQELVVTYSLVEADTNSPGARNCRKITPLDGLMAASSLPKAAVRAEINAAFAMWEAVADIRFHEAESPASADILIGAQVEPEGWAFADVFYDTASREAVKPISKALVCLNPTKRWKIGFDGDLKIYDLRYTIAHEVGHAIGLDHPAVPGQIMGYRYEEEFRTLQAGDIAAAALVYGGRQRDIVAEAPATARSSVTPARWRFAKRWGTRAFKGRSP